MANITGSNATTPAGTIMTTLNDVVSSYRVDNEMVKVVVGPQKIEYSLHKRLLTSTSTFFSAALLGDWQEAQSATVKLPDEAPAIFEQFGNWLYYGTGDWLRSIKAAHESTNPHGASALGLCDPYVNDASQELLDQTQLWRADTLFLIKAFFFGDHIQCLGFRNAVIDCLSSYSEIGHVLSTSRFIMDKVFDTPTTTRSLQNLMVDTFIVKHGIGSNVNPWSSTQWEALGLPSDMIFKCADRMSRAGQMPIDLSPGLSSETCKRYHEHKEGKECRPPVVAGIDFGTSGAIRVAQAQS